MSTCCTILLKTAAVYVAKQKSDRERHFHRLWPLLTLTINWYQDGIRYRTQPGTFWKSAKSETSSHTTRQPAGAPKPPLWPNENTQLTEEDSWEPQGITTSEFTYLKLPVPKIDRNNYTTWKIAIATSGTSLGASNHATSNPPPQDTNSMEQFQIKQATAKLIIVNSLPAEIVAKISKENLNDTHFNLI